MTHDVSCIPNGHFCKKKQYYTIYTNRGAITEIRVRRIVGTNLLFRTPWPCVPTFTLEILGCNSVQSEQLRKIWSENKRKKRKKGKRILEVNKRISCEMDLCSLTIRFEAKKKFKRNGCTLLPSFHPPLFSQVRQATTSLGTEQTVRYSGTHSDS